MVLAPLLVIGTPPPFPPWRIGGFDEGRASTVGPCDRGELGEFDEANNMTSGAFGAV